MLENRSLWSRLRIGTERFLQYKLSRDHRERFSAFSAPSAVRCSSVAIRRLDLRSLGALAKNPLTHVGRALLQFNALLFAANQEPNHRYVHQCDLAQVQDFARATVVHFRSNAGDTIRLDAAAEEESRDASVAEFFNPQHRSITQRGPR